jgi:hypothetical protein
LFGPSTGCMLEKEGKEEAQISEEVVEKRNEYTHENL